MATGDGRQPSAFGALLKQLRGSLGLTQEELAERAGVSSRLVSDLERGVIQRPRRDTARMLADALELNGPERERFLDARRPVPAGGSGHLPPAHGPAASPDGLIGRERELAAIVQTLTEPGPRLVTLSGMGGVGKTRLALEAARLLRAAYPDGLWFIDLTPVRDASLLLRSIGNAAGIQEAPGESPVEALARAFAGRAVLLVLDNLEHLPTASESVAALLAQVPGLRVLATSREPLRLREEVEFPVDPLAIPDAAVAQTAAALAGNPAVGLLVRRASAVRPSFELTDGNAAAVAEIVQRVDGLPLAIELVAVRLRSLAPADLAQRLERRLPLLTRGARDAPARHQTMAAAIDWSYQLLTEPEQLVYRRFAVFDGGARLDAVEAVCGHDLAADVLDLMQSLVEKHLIQSVEAGDGETRFRMLETVREHGIDRLVEAGEERQARDLHMIWWARFAERAKPELTGADQERWVRRIAEDHDNVRAALRWAIGTGDAAAAHGITAGLIRFWALRGYLLEARDWFDAALALGEDQVTQARAEALLGAGVIACFLGDYATAKRHTERAFPIFEQLGDGRGMGSVFGNLGLIADVQGHYDEARTLYQEALGRFRAVGDVTQAGYMLGNLGMIAYDRGDYAQAIALHREALAGWRELNDTDSIAHSLSALGQSACALGDYGEATRLQIEALELREALGNESGIAKCLECLAEIATATAEAERAAWLLGAANAIREATGATAHPVDRAALDRVAECAREAIGRRGFTRAWSAGGLASRETVLAVAVDRQPLPASS